VKKRPRIFSGILLVALGAALAGCGSSGGSGGASAKQGAGAPPQVTVSAAVQQPVPIETSAIGNAQAFRTVQVKSMVDGQIDRVLFQQGEYVHAGQTLFELDKRPFQAALDQAEGNLARDEATAANNQANAQRAEALLKQGIVAPQDAQTAVAQAQSSQAAVAADKAAVETAKVNLGYTVIKAPIEAKAGEILVNLGNLVKANDTNPLTTLNQIEPIYVSFNIPEAQLEAVRAGGIGKLPVAAAQPNSNQNETGTLTFVDNSVDPTTGTIKLLATFANHDRSLWPGEFLNVTLRLGVDRNAIIVPAAAVQTGPTGKFVYVVESDGTAKMAAVNSSRNYKQMAVIDSGIKAGDQVIVDGQMLVTPNAKVNVVKTVAATAGAEQVAQNSASTGNSQ
jgi:multidrug efflux system membrane fusion protein